PLLPKRPISVVVTPGTKRTTSAIFCACCCCNSVALSCCACLLLAVCGACAVTDTVSSSGVVLCASSGKAIAWLTASANKVYCIVILSCGGLFAKRCAFSHSAANLLIQPVGKFTDIFVIAQYAIT